MNTRASMCFAALAALAPVVAAGALAGCNSMGSRSTSDPYLMRGGQPAPSEMAQLCELQRQMTGKTPEAQEAMLESHLQAVHGSSNPQVMAMHKQTMLQQCSGR
jgi:hypothetical protein